MENFDNSFKEENIVVISIPDGKVYKRLKDKILTHILIPKEEWIEVNENELNKLKRISFEFWKDRFGSEPINL